MLKKIKNWLRGSGACAARVEAGDAWILDGICTVEDARAGIFITGAPSAGKTATVGRAIRRNLLRSGAGGLANCCKVGEFEQLQRDCELTGRTDDLVEFVIGGDECFDILNTELMAPGGTSTSAAAICDVVGEVGARNGATQGGEDSFWDKQTSKGYRHAITIISKVTGSCSVSDVYMMFTTAAVSQEQAQDPKWQMESYAWKIIEAGLAMFPDDYDFLLAASYFRKEWPELGEKTRGCCLAMVTNCLDPFMTADMMKLTSSGKTTHGPASALEGKILGINIPVLRYKRQAMQFAAAMKLGVQSAALRRDIYDDTPDVFVFSDEAQFFMIPSNDMMVSTVSREQRLTHVHIAQNLPMLYSVLSGTERARNEVEGWISCHLTRIALSNTCPITAEFYSKQYGESWQDVLGDTWTMNNTRYSPTSDWFGQPQPSGPSMSFNRQPQLLRDVPPEYFGRLHRTSRREPWSDGYVFKGGEVFPETGRPWKCVSFPYLAPGPMPKAKPKKPKALTYEPKSTIRVTRELPLQLEGPKPT